MLASDDQNSEFSGARNPDSVLHVQFYTKPVQDNFRTAKEGAAIFRDEQFIKIMIPGRNDLEIDEPVEERHKQRFPRQWAHFMNMNADTELLVGTPVTEWPAITRGQAEELRAKKFYTVQQIAECGDGQIQSLGMNANQLRQKARAFVETAKGTAAATAHADELAKRDAELDAMRAQIAELTAAVKGGHPSKPAKKTRAPMSADARAAAGKRLTAARAAKKAQQQAPQAPQPEA